MSEDRLMGRGAKCGCEIKGYPAISRKDNKTLLCQHCGTREPLEMIGMSENEIQKIMDKIDAIEREIKNG